MFQNKGEIERGDDHGIKVESFHEINTIRWLLSYLKTKTSGKRM